MKITLITFFIEGEENPRDTRPEWKLRQTLGRVFGELRSLALSRGVSMQFRLYGSRRAAYERLREAVESRRRTGVYPLLLVDSEDPVECGDPLREPAHCWKHLEERQADRWPRPDGAEDAQCQLMVQAIEAWLFADPDALESFYGKSGFRRSALPRKQNVERISKSEHVKALEAATKDTQKGRYHKVKHLAPLLARIDVAAVRQRAPHCERIFVTLRAKIEQLPAPGT